MATNSFIYQPCSIRPAAVLFLCVFSTFFFFLEFAGCSQVSYLPRSTTQAHCQKRLKAHFPVHVLFFALSRLASHFLFPLSLSKRSRLHHENSLQLRSSSSLLIDLLPSYFSSASFKSPVPPLEEEDEECDETKVCLDTCRVSLLYLTNSDSACRCFMCRLTHL